MICVKIIHGATEIIQGSLNALSMISVNIIFNSLLQKSLFKCYIFYKQWFCNCDNTRKS